ncbi:NAD(P)-dependent alcohol dehydrogenase [Mucilaginibacter robiniae]|uniref:NAD(P)-dependent alcohol dehydrogenase n=1 Tax=Mucilaginibacter robiniae TaxID=2728022 RepID=A0A7L5E969_9SPHI|nr:NAD(P)-dependent alcohol dehydrogenase [Mucilaginibacter robiniae]QJD97423.1 NAD(P)-dependent alcohol dehydrogenase [Mucilaginibacter robiniae]
MKAAIIEGYGEADKFTLKEVPTPELEDCQILINNKASSVNPVDVLVRKGKLKLMTGLFGEHIIGSDFSGVVIASKSKKFKVGDEVYGFKNALKGHAYAEQVAVDEDNAALKPVGLSFTEAASLPLAASTAWQAMVEDGKLKQGARVLINGCTGGVGTAAVQIAKSFECHITGVCNGKNADFAKSLGCDVVIDYKKEKIPENEQYDLFFDANGGLTISDVKSNIAPEGMFVSTRGGMDGVKGAITGAVDVLLQSKMKIVQVVPKTIDLQKLQLLVDQGKLKPYVTATFSLAELQQAHEMQEQGGFTGKIAVAIS